MKRTEKDILGTKELSENTLYGINTARALENFDLNQKKMNRELIRAIVIVKKAAAVTYLRLKTGDEEKEKAIIKACDRILNRECDLEKCFPLQALQGGAGTSANMNVNEVLANLALLELGRQPGEYYVIHPLDDVNRGQSTNDVYPTALRIAASYVPALGYDQVSRIIRDYSPEEAIQELKKRLEQNK